MTPRESRRVMDRLDLGRRATTYLLQQLDAGVPPWQAVQELGPSLSPAAVEAAVRLAGLCSYDFTCLAIVLSGLASDSVIERVMRRLPLARGAPVTPGAC